AQSRKTPPNVNPAARLVAVRSASGFHGIAALAVLALGGGDGQAHLLSDRARQVSAYRMRLPSGGLLQLLGRDAARPLQQFEDLGGLAAVTGGTALLFGFGRLLGRGGLLPRLALLARHVRATWANT